MRVKVVTNVVKKKGAPAYMVSFGDMMTLILCFFILLVSLSQEQNYGMLAKGLGSFVISIQSFGLSGILGAEEQQAVYDDVRRRFNLPPEPDPERRSRPEEASSLELLRAEALEALRPRRELRQPGLAGYSGTSSDLSEAAKRNIDAQADSLRPAPGQVLLLEGHPPPRAAQAADPSWIAFRRAAAVREYLVEHHGFAPERVESRAWLVEIGDDPRMTDVVHARLVLPDDEDRGSKR